MELKHIRELLSIIFLPSIRAEYFFCRRAIKVENGICIKVKTKMLPFTKPPWCWRCVATTTALKKINTAVLLRVNLINQKQVLFAREKLTACEAERGRPWKHFSSPLSRLIIRINLKSRWGLFLSQIFFCKRQHFSQHWDTLLVFHFALWKNKYSRAWVLRKK